MELKPNELRCLRLLDSAVKELEPAGHTLVNNNVKRLIELGLVDYAAGRRAYKLTALGKKVLNA